MTLTNASAATAIRVLDQCSTEFEPAGPWRWKCVVHNGTRQCLLVMLGDGLLELAGQTEECGATARALEEALRANRVLPGGVRFALEGSNLHRRADLLLREEVPLLARLRWILAGFHPNPFESHNEDAVDLPNSGPQLGLAEMLRETAWACTERAPNVFSVDLGSDAATSATIRAQNGGLALSAELAGGAPATQASSQALNLFLLTANSIVRLARAYRVDEAGQQRFGFQVCLPATPTAGELEEGLAALSVAHRSCAREAKVLLDDAAARCYLSVREVQS
jgi:hypothetical protein